MRSGTIQKEFFFRQINEGSANDVFPLLCPVREKDWIDGWEFDMVHSKSGLAEQGCVFITPNHGNSESTWYINKYDKLHHIIEFVRFTPGETVVKIYIQLNELSDYKTEANITYQYTGLNEQQNEFIENNMQDSFQQSMLYWEKAINHYLKTGKKLNKL